MAKTSSNEFLLIVAPEHRMFVEKLNDELLKQGHELIIKEVKSGYIAIYQLERKTAVNWMSRKAGIRARIYGDNAGRHEEVVIVLPTHTQKKTAAPRDCKRPTNSDVHSGTCMKGFIYSPNGEIQKECRNDGMLFLLVEGAAEYIAGLICAEAAVCKLTLRRLNC